MHDNGAEVAHEIMAHEIMAHGHECTKHSSVWNSALNHSFSQMKRQWYNKELNYLLVSWINPDI